MGHKGDINAAEKISMDKGSGKRKRGGSYTIMTGLLLTGFCK